MKLKFINANAAIRKAIRNGNRVIISQACGEPQTLLEALAEEIENFKNIEIVSGLLLHDYEFLKKSEREHYQYTTTLVTQNTREAVRAGIVNFVPLRHLDFVRAFSLEEGRTIDVAFIQVSPPDHLGYCNLGVSVGYNYLLSQNANIVVAEVNEEMPRTHGQTSLHVSSIDYFVPVSRPLRVYSPPNVFTDIEHKIAQHVAELIPDGSTLQIGIGSIASAILPCLKGKRDLGVHSGMITDDILELIYDGVVNNVRKKINRRITVSGELMGSQRLFDFADDNKSIELYPLAYTHDPRILGKLDNFISMTSALEMDLMGQANSESVEGVQTGGVGGQFDFIEGAFFSRGGKSIIAMPSTARSEKISRIVPKLCAGSVVTIPRYATDYVVTEYGIARIYGKSLHERAEALISIAHPKFRNELWNEFFSKKN